MGLEDAMQSMEGLCSSRAPVLGPEARRGNGKLQFSRTWGPLQLQTPCGSRVHSADESFIPLIYQAVIFLVPFETFLQFLESF